MTQLHTLAMRIAAHVGEHSSRVEEINQELASSNRGETASVVAAVAKLLAANQQMERQLENAEEKIQEQARLVETTAAEARTDALTGLANRRAFDDELRGGTPSLNGRGSRTRSSSATSTNSSGSTTPTDIRWATRCCVAWQSGFARGAGDGRGRPLRRRGIRRHPAGHGGRRRPDDGRAASQGGGRGPFPPQRAGTECNRQPRGRGAA